MTKPFIKWVGGKTQIINQIIEKIPNKINNYYEPFLGGGAVLIELMKQLNFGKIEISGNIFVSDINPILISTYKNIKKYSNSLIKKLDELEKNYLNTPMEKIYEGKRPRNMVAKNIELAKKSREELYYFYRNEFNIIRNKEKITKHEKIYLSSLFIFLNKTGFRGLYRESNNKFNVAFGYYKKPLICDSMNIKNLSKEFKKNNVSFKCIDFYKIKNKIQENDFIYLDSPYYPENEKSFVNYMSGGFSEGQHQKLKQLCDKIVQKKGLFLESNSSTQKIKDLYKKYNMTEILCKRSINSKNPESKIMEILISNKPSKIV